MMDTTQLRWDGYRAWRPLLLTGSLLVGLVVEAAWMGTVVANHLGNPANDIDDVRNSLGPGEGYLNFRTAGHGEEYTGHTDVSGFDFADNWVTIRPVRLTDSAGVAPMNATVDLIGQDFDFIRKIYAQAGLGVRQLPTVNVNLGVTWANFHVDEMITTANGQNNNGGVMNLYYAKSLADFGGSNGVTAPPSLVGAMPNGATVAITNPFSYVVDSRVFNTSAHEIGHQLLNGNALWDQHATPSESQDTTNLMFVAGTQSSTDLDDVGQMLSPTVGGHDIIEHRVDATTMGVQISRMHENGGPRNGIPAFVQHANFHDTHGDRADFDWVTDQRLIEAIAGGGNGADHSAGVDFLQWEINPGAVAASNHTGPSTDNHVHAGLGELALDAFKGPYFKLVDVVSNINLYADNDINTATGAISARSKALDYHIPDFSEDGVTWFPGSLVSVFQQGWTPISNIENYIARWQTDIEAKFLRITGVGAAVVGHDGNTQIDAVIARVPEPESLVLFFAALGILGCPRQGIKFVALPIRSTM